MVYLNHRFGDSFICERLNRALANENWCNNYPNAKVYHLATSSSDHSPILLNMHDQVRKKPQFFRYEIAWSIHEDFINLINDCWKIENSAQNQKSFCDIYPCFKSRAIYWKKHVFGNLERKIDNLENQIDDTLKNINNFDSKEYQKKLINLQKDHQTLLKQKEIYWKQRSRINWLKEGDNNKKFFHAHASNRRRINLIQRSQR